MQELLQQLKTIESPYDRLAFLLEHMNEQTIAEIKKTLNIKHEPCIGTMIGGATVSSRKEFARLAISEFTVMEFLGFTKEQEEKEHECIEGCGYFDYLPALMNHYLSYHNITATKIAQTLQFHKVENFQAPKGIKGAIMRLKNNGKKAD